MYEQTQLQPSSPRRSAWAIILGFCVIAAVAGVLVWLLFFRGHKEPAHAPNNGNTSQTGSTSQDKDNGSPDDASSTNSNNATGDSDAAPSQPSDTTPTTSQSAGSPTQLANAGAGDVVTPVVVTVIAGVAAYHIRLRRKLKA